MKEKLLSYYQKNFSKFGENERSLGWTKGKQQLRFFQLTRHFELEGTRVIDVGCGFGDFLAFAQRQKRALSSYLGVDVVPEFIDIAKSRHSGVGIEFQLDDYLERAPLEADYVFGSGIFGLRLFEDDLRQYAHMRKVFAKAWSEARQGIAFDFISDKVDFRSGSGDFHASPEKVLALAYEFSRRVILDNSAMPFEFSVVLFKDQSFSARTTVFDATQAKYPDMIEGSQS